MAGTSGPSQQSGKAVNPIESLRNIQGQDFDRMPESHSPHEALDRQPRGNANPEFTREINVSAIRERDNRTERIREVQELLMAIRSEVHSIKTHNSSLNAEVENIERNAMQGLPEHVGIYHVRHFELILKYLRNIRTKVENARIWMMTSQGKSRAKRGSAYATNVKKSGAQFSLSAELQAARSVS